MLENEMNANDRCKSPRNRFIKAKINEWMKKKMNISEELGSF